MDTSELLAKVRRIQIVTSHLVNDVLAGSYTSAFRGTGMDFDEVREYQPGDDIRDIDWNVTARAGSPYVKRFVEEREMTVMILVDGSASTAYGSADRSKRDLAAEVSAVLACSALECGDKVGLVLFTDEINLYLPPKKGRSHLQRVVREILSFSPKGAKTDIRNALDFLGGVLKKRAVVFLVSDFFDKNYEDPLNIASHRHDLIAVRIGDRRETEALPPMGLVRLEDAETGEQIVVDTSSREARENFLLRSRDFSEKLDQSFQRRGIDRVELNTEDDIVLPLRKLFRRRDKKRSS